MTYLLLPVDFFYKLCRSNIILDIQMSILASLKMVRKKYIWFTRCTLYVHYVYDTNSNIIHRVQIVLHSRHDLTDIFFHNRRNGLTSHFCKELDW